MFTFHDAQRSVLATLRSRFPSLDLVITRVFERPYGWDFCYQTRRYVESGRSGDALLGPGPLLILNADGTIIPRFTGLSVENELRDFEQGHEKYAGSG